MTPSATAQTERREHVCREDKTCCCSMTALEPSEDCPRHGNPWPPRCECGRFVKRRHIVKEMEATA